MEKNNLIGNIIKIHSDFHYIKMPDGIVFECKLREKIKKKKMDVFVGDRVRLEEVNFDSKQAAIAEILKRKNFIPRPAIANIDQIIITAALNYPELDFIQLNRYLTRAKIYNIPAIICINKSDLEDKEDFKSKIKQIYKPLGYKVIFTCATDGQGVEELLNELESKVSVLCGISGVGKSSLLNIINPELKLRTRELSLKSNRGTHTTRHVELIDLVVNEKSITVGDTPGFSYLKFDNILPREISNLFSEISNLGQNCFFRDCLHLHESKCNVINNLNKIEGTRYESYKLFVSEALEYKDKLLNSGHKIEKKTKTIDSRSKEKIKIIKLGSQTREKSRKTHKQNLNFISILDRAYYNNEENLE